MSVTYAEFIADPLRKERITVEITGKRLSDLATVTVRASSNAYTTEPGDTPANQTFDRRIIGGFTRSTSAVGVGEGGTRYMSGLFPSAQSSTIRLKQFFGDLDTGAASQLSGTSIRDIAFGGRRIVVKHGGECSKGVLPFASYRVLTDGVVSGPPAVHDSEVVFPVRGNEARLQTVAQQRVLFGTDRCIVFNGTTTNVNCGADTAFNFTTQSFSVSFLIYVEANPASEASVVTRGYINTDGWGVHLSTSGEIVFRTNQGTPATQATISSAVAKDRWVQVQVTRTGAAATIYLDGENANVTSGAHVNPTSNAARALLFGVSPASTGWFAGALDEIRIDNTPRTEQEFDEEMQRELDLAEWTDFLGYWNCNDGSGAITTLDNKGSVDSAADGTVTAGFCAASCMGRGELYGRRMPWVGGQFNGMRPICVDAGRQLYLVHSSKMEEITSVRTGGGDIYVAGTSYTSWLAFIVASTADGAIDRCISPGWSLFRIGGEPRHKVTVHGKGDKSDGTYRNTVGALVRYIVATLGQQPLDDATEIHDASFDTFEAACPYVVNYMFADDRDVQKVVTDLVSTYNAGCWFRRSDGLLSIKKLDAPSSEAPVATLTRNAVSKGAGITPLERSAPIGSWTLRYDENQEVMGAGDLLESLSADDPDAASFYRLQWRKAYHRSPVVLTRHLDAPDLEITTRFVNRADANSEKYLRAALAMYVDQGFSFHCRPQSVELDFGDVVIFHYQDIDQYNEPQNRFGTHADARFYVIGISDMEEGGYTLDLWRPKVV